MRFSRNRASRFHRAASKFLQLYNSISRESNVLSAIASCRLRLIDFEDAGGKGEEHACFRIPKQRRKDAGQSKKK
jgi:hypothetical protein